MTSHGFSGGSYPQNCQLIKEVNVNCVSFSVGGASIKHLHGFIFICDFLYFFIQYQIKDGGTRWDKWTISMCMSIDCVMLYRFHSSGWNSFEFMCFHFFSFFICFSIKTFSFLKTGTTNCNIMSVYRKSMRISSYNQFTTYIHYLLIHVKVSHKYSVIL